MLKEKEAPAQDEQMRKRKQYLMEQREKLLNMKREARMKAFANAEGDAKQERPRTAKAAKAALSGRASAAPAAKISDEVLQARKALAQKLKAEVMGIP